MKSLVRPYGLVAEVGKSSVTGTDAGSPYTCHARCARIGAEARCGQQVATAGLGRAGAAHTVADDEKTMFLQPTLPITLRSLTVPLMLFS